MLLISLESQRKYLGPTVLVTRYAVCYMALQFITQYLLASLSGFESRKACSLGIKPGPSLLVLHQLGSKF